MQIRNIERLLCFAKADDRVMALGELQNKYDFEPDGTNFYYGINPQNRDRFEADGEALNGFTHRPFFDGIIEDLRSSQAQEKTVVLGLEPPQRPDAFSFVAASDDLVRKLAQELQEYQAEALAGGKRLHIVVRYASEMNDVSSSSAGQHNQYAGRPEEYRPSFRQVREIFRSEAPEILFAFSPAIRRDLNEPGLSGYWPGDDVVDIISCTWYIGAPGQVQGAVAFMKSYVLHREVKGKPFGVDELGGCDSFGPNNTLGRNNDAVLRSMLQQLLDLEEEGIRFAYVTLFLERKWGMDATLQFLPNP